MTSKILYCIYDCQPVVVNEHLCEALGADEHGNWHAVNYADAMTKAKLLSQPEFNDVFKARGLVAVPATFTA